MAKVMNYTYEQYCTDLVVVEATLLTEGIIDTLKGVPRNLMGFIKPLREYFPDISIKDIIKAFKSTKVFSILKTFGFSIAKIAKSINKGLSLIDGGLLKVMEKLGKTGTLQKMKRGIIKLDDVIDKHPILNRITGVGVAGILLVIWLNMSFSGNFDGDMDLSHMFKALAGNFSLEELFGTAVGGKMLALLSLGITTGGTVSFPWLLKSSVNLSLALSYSIFKLAKAGDINMEEIKNRIKRKKLKEGLTMNFKEYLTEGTKPPKVKGVKWSGRPDKDGYYNVKIANDLGEKYSVSWTPESPNEIYWSELKGGKERGNMGYMTPDTFKKDPNNMDGTW